MSSFGEKTFFEKTTPNYESVIVTRTSFICAEFSYGLLYLFYAETT